jgi:hypothetical protein
MQFNLPNKNDILFEKSCFTLSTNAFKIFLVRTGCINSELANNFAYWMKKSLLLFVKQKIQVSEAFRLRLAEPCTVDFSLAKTKKELYST